MKYVKVSSVSYVNLEQIKEITLFTTITGKFYWNFIYDGVCCDESIPIGAASKTFDTKEEAYKWFEEMIKPVIMGTEND